MDLMVKFYHKILCAIFLSYHLHIYLMTHYFCFYSHASQVQITGKTGPPHH